MNIRNLPNCANPDTIFNVGKPLCDITKKKLKGVIFTDKGVEFTPADTASIATFIAALRTRTTAPRGQRVYPIFDINNFEDNTGDPTTGGVGNLTTATIVTSDAVPAFSFGYSGGEIRHKRLSELSGASLDVFFLDTAYTLYGTENGANIKGYNVLQAYADTSKFIVSDAVNQYRFRITLADISEYRENSAFIVTNSGIMSLQGLVNINNVLAAPFTTGTFTIQPIADGGTNLQQLYGVTFASAGLWSAKLADGTPVTISSVANNVGQTGYDITIAGAAFTALSVGDTLRINQAAATALAAAGIKPYEGMEAIITKVAP
jgi:hypothetical protein